MEYKIQYRIGRGAFSKVYKASSSTGTVAIKQIKLSKLTPKLKECLLSEVKILKQLKHKNIIKLFDIQRTETKLNLIMEYSEIGDFESYLENKKLSENETKDILTQIRDAMKYLNSFGIIHRDLKPQNILIFERDGRVQIKIADFGFARYVDSNLADTLCGSPMYMAPEILKFKKYDAKVDLWSIGAIFYKMLFGKAIFSAMNHLQLLKAIEIKSIELPEDNSVSDQCKDLLCRLLKTNPAERIGLEGFFNHPFLNTISSSYYNNLSMLSVILLEITKDKFSVLASSLIDSYSDNNWKVLTEILRLYFTVLRVYMEMISILQNERVLNEEESNFNRKGNGYKLNINKNVTKLSSNCKNVAKLNVNENITKLNTNENITELNTNYKNKYIDSLRSSSTCYKKITNFNHAKNESELSPLKS